MTNIEIKRELSNIIREFNEDLIDDTLKSPFAKEHLKEFIEIILNELTSLYEQIDYDRIMNNNKKVQKCDLLSELNKLKCLLIELKCKLQSNNTNYLKILVRFYK